MGRPKLRNSAAGLAAGKMAAASLVLNRNAPVVIVDASYFVFYRFFATSRWWSFRKPPPPEPASMSDPGFRDAFLKHAAADITKLQKQWSTTPGNLLFCADCSRADIWRMSIFPEYKASRIVNTRFDPGAFKAVYDWLDEARIPVLRHPKLEADDVACLVFRKIRRAAPDAKVVFITGDHDYLQLKDDATEIFSLEGKKGTNLWEAGVKKGTHDMTRKILLGDPSDNIPPVLTKSQVTHYLSLPDDERAPFLEALGKTQEYERNLRLMSWACIPADADAAFDAELGLTLEDLGPAPKKRRAKKT